MSETEDFDDAGEAPPNSGTLIQEPTAAAVTASLSIKKSDAEISVPISALLGGKAVVQRIDAPGGKPLQFRVILKGDRIEIAILKGRTSPEPIDEQ